MKYLIQKIKFFFKIIFLSKKILSPPKKTKILIYDKNSINITFNYLKKYDPEVLHIRGEKLNLFILLIFFLKLTSYKDEYINFVNPKIIISSIDNDIGVYKLKIKHGKIKFIIIQNGWRDFTDIFSTLSKLKQNKLENFKVDYFLTFGQSIANMYKNYISSNYIVMGSIKNNESKIFRHKKNNDIAFISQWGSSAFLENKVCSEILSFLEKYSLIHNKKLKIILRNKNAGELQKKEIDYFSRILKRKLELNKDFYHEGPYRGCDKASVVVGVDSSLCYESISRGNRTAIFSIRDDFLLKKKLDYGIKNDTYGFPGGFSFGWPKVYGNNGFFWTNINDELEFKRILHNLFNVSDIEWQKTLIKNKINDLIIYDNDNSRFKDFLNKELTI